MHVDEHRCPRCGQPNACALARGDAHECWCTRVVFAPEALAAIPEAARNRACLCAACATAKPPAGAPRT